MKAVVYAEKGKFEIREKPKPSVIDATDAIVRVTTASICTRDLHIRAGAVPRAVPGITVGHEFVGVVEEVGRGVSRFSVGDRVAVNVETFCGHCFYCRHGWVNNCTDPAGGWAMGCRIDGCQTEYVRVPFADNGLTPIPAHVSDEKALFTGDLLSTGYWAADIGEVSEGDVVAIIGAGPTGICTAMCVRMRNPSKIVMIDVQRERLEFAESHGLADVTVLVPDEDPEEVLRSITYGRGADVVMEVAGGRDTFQTAWRIARPNAIVVVVAVPVTLITVKGYQKLAEPAPPSTTVAESLVGRTGVVVTATVPGTMRGKVRIDNDIWSATSDEPIEEGARVTVDSSEGVHVHVSRLRGGSCPWMQRL